MSEYIERGALMKGLKEDHDYLMQDPEISSTKKWHEAILYDRVRRIVENAPAADVVEVKHGRWVEKDCVSKSNRGRVIHYVTNKCSVCGEWNGRHKNNYCPNCGAKMRGDGE